MTKDVKFYHIPSEFEGLPYSVISVDGVFYSFGITVRSLKGIWEEVKDKLDSLESFDPSELDIDFPEYEIENDI